MRIHRRKPRRRDRGEAQPAPGSVPGSNQTVPGQAAADETVTAKAAEVTPLEAVSPKATSAEPASAEPASAEPASAEPASAEPASAETMGAAMQLAIAVLTAGLDSPELEAWAADTLTPVDADGLGDFMAGLHVVSVLLLHELHEATGEPPAAILQRLAILAEHRRGTPSAG